MSYRAWVQGWYTQQWPPGWHAPLQLRYIFTWDLGTWMVYPAMATRVTCSITTAIHFYLRPGYKDGIPSNGHQGDMPHYNCNTFLPETWVHGWYTQQWPPGWHAPLQLQYIFTWDLGTWMVYPAMATRVTCPITTAIHFYLIPGYKDGIPSNGHQGDMPHYNCNTFLPDTWVQGWYTQQWPPGWHAPLQLQYIFTWYLGTRMVYPAMATRVTCPITTAIHFYLRPGYMDGIPSNGHQGDMPH